ncbi:MAG: glycosyltransferase family 39 protein [Nanoarchaeota archaeon]
MDENPVILEVAKEKKKVEKFFLSWIKDNDDKIFLAILGVAFLLRIWFFFKTFNQPLWWDEADYMSAAKNIGLSLGTQDSWYYRRGFLFALMSAPFFTLGIGEIGVRFAEILFSVGFIFVSYLLIGKMFDKKLALYTSVALAFSWILLFYTGRVMTDVPAAFFILFSFFLFWKGYISKEGNKFIYISGAIFGLAVLTRMQSLMMIPAFMVPVFLKEKHKMFVNKKIWIGALIFVLVMLPQVYLYSQHYGNPALDLASHYLGIGEKVSPGNERTIATMEILKYIFDLPYMLSSWIFYLLFLPGLFFFFADLIFGFDKVFQNEKVQNKFIVLFWILCVFLVIGYINQADDANYVDQRYITAALPFLFLVAVSPLVKIEKALEGKMGGKTSTILSVIIIISILMIPNLLFAKNLMEQKTVSYSEVMEAGLWINENSNPSDSVISNSLPQILYYSERSTYPFDPGFFYGTKLGNKDFLKYADDEESFMQFVSDYKPKYLVMSIYESIPEWAQTLPERKPEMFSIAKVFYQNQNPSLIIYEFKYK